MLAARRTFTTTSTHLLRIFEVVGFLLDRGLPAGYAALDIRNWYWGIGVDYWLWTLAPDARGLLVGL